MSYYFDKETSVKSNEVITRADISGRLYTFKTDNNVFSKNSAEC